MTFDFTSISRAGLTQAEFANLAKVSRVTVNMWVRGKVAPHRYTEERVGKLIALTHLATVRTHLPVPPEIARGARLSAIKAALRATVEESRQASESA